MVALIVQAATRVLERESLAGFNTNRVAAVAGISVGSLYQYFPNKASLVATLIEQAQETLAQSIKASIEATSDLGLVPSLHALARLAIDQQYAKPLLAAALDHEELRLPVEGVLRLNEQKNTDCLVIFLKRYQNEISCEAVPTAARDMLAITKALVEADATRNRQPPVDLQERIVRALQGYLQCPTSTVKR